MAIGTFDFSRAVALGDSVAFAYHIYDIAAGNQDQFPNSKLPDGYDTMAQIFVNDSLFDDMDDDGGERKLAILQYLGKLFNIDKPAGVIGINSMTKDIIVAFRGTQTAFEWIHDGELFKLPFSVSDGTSNRQYGSVEFGFASLYTNCTVGQDPVSGKRCDAPTVRDYLMQTLDGESVTFTGHSLGAALATLAAADASVSLSGKAGALSVMTFASPLVGDKTFAGMFDQLLPDSWRIANRPDIVTYLPPPFVGYSHVATEYPLNSDHLTKHSIPCWHALETYLYLLDPTGHPLQKECSL